MTGAKEPEHLEKTAGWVAAAVIGGGCAAAATQIIVLRECLALFYGSELTVGLVLFFWLFWTGLGSLAGGRLFPNLFPKPSAQLRFVLVLVVLYGLLLPSTVLWIRASRSLFGLNLGELAPLEVTVTVIAAVSAPVCVFFGVFFGSAWSAVAAITTSPRGIFRLYALEALGAALGGIWLYGFLVPRLPVLYGAACLGAALAALGFLALAAQAPKTGRIRRLLIGAVMALAVSAAGLLEEPTRRWQWGPEVVAVVDSPYRNMAILRQETQWSLMADGLWLFSSPDPQSAEDDVHLAMLQHPAPKRVLVLGPLSPDSLQEILRYPGIQRVDVVDPDRTVFLFAAMVKASGTAPLGEDSRVFVWDTDIRRFVEKAESTYDVVLLNAGDPFSLGTNRFHTQEFYRSVARALRPGGVFSFAVSGAEDMLGEAQAAYFTAVVQTLRSVFPRHVIYPGERIRLAASKAPEHLTEDPKALSNRAARLGFSLRYVRDDRLENLLDPFRLDYFRSLADRKDRGGINRDMDPVGFIAASRLWAAQFHPGFSAFMQRLAPSFGPLSTLMAAAAVAVLLLGSPAAIFRTRPEAALAGAVGAMGAAQMAFQILLLFLYQIVAGALYAHITVLVSIGMAGLSAGAFLVGSFVKGRETVFPEVRGFLGVHGAATLLLGAMFPLLETGGLGALRLWPSWAVLSIFSAFGFVAGVAGGAHFALACLVGERVGFNRGAVGGILYGTDLLGAAAAAVATPWVLVPLLGGPKVFLAYGLVLCGAWVMSRQALRSV
uniref:Polyamine aminopropyltransferase n=1 Tax=Desulfacinum infernum TaxID=35837 RepID=A0A832A065_9BACT